VANLFDTKFKVTVLSAGLVLLVAAGFAYWKVFFYPYESTDDAYIDGVSIDVSAEQSGRIVQLFVDEGDHVEKGQLLFLLDD
jgi:membrane fusion protein, multidrug efflux system